MSWSVSPSVIAVMTAGFMGYASTSRIQGPEGDEVEIDSSMHEERAFRTPDNAEATFLGEVAMMVACVLVYAYIGDALRLCWSLLEELCMHVLRWGGSLYLGARSYAMSLTRRPPVHIEFARSLHVEPGEFSSEHGMEESEGSSGSDDGSVGEADSECEAESCGSSDALDAVRLHRVVLGDKELFCLASRVPHLSEKLRVGNTVVVLLFDMWEIIHVQVEVAVKVDDGAREMVRTIELPQEYQYILDHFILDLEGLLVGDNGERHKARARPSVHASVARELVCLFIQSTTLTVRGGTFTLLNKSGDIDVVEF